MMINPVLLLGQSLAISVEPGADHCVAEVLPIIQGACDVLNAQAARGQLNPTMLQYIRALRGLGVGATRGFTACKGTADEDCGLFVYYVGDADVKVNADAQWYASTIIHDGGHAWLSQQNQPATGVDVEQALTQVQVDYYNAVGGRPTYIQALQDYIDNRPMILARMGQDIGLA